MKQLYNYIILLFCFTYTSAATAQPEGKRDKIEALRIAFITQKVNFTTQESQAFWPLYNEYNDKLENLKKSFRKQYIKNIDFSTLTDKEAESYLNAELNLKQKEYETYKEYFDKFKKILPVKKIALLRRAEEEFRKELIKNIRANGNSSD